MTLWIQRLKLHFNFNSFTNTWTHSFHVSCLLGEEAYCSGNLCWSMIWDKKALFFFLSHTHKVLFYCLSEGPSFPESAMSNEVYQALSLVSKIVDITKDTIQCHIMSFADFDILSTKFGHGWCIQVAELIINNVYSDLWCSLGSSSFKYAYL